MKEILKRKSVVTTVLVPLAVTLGMAIASSDVAADEHSKSYKGITQQMFDNCVKPRSSNETHGSNGGWAEYDDGNKGEVRLKSKKLFYTEPAELDFVYEPGKKELMYIVKRKSFGVGYSDIWGGFNGTMKKCEN